MNRFEVWEAYEYYFFEKKKNRRRPTRTGTNKFVIRLTIELLCGIYICWCKKEQEYCLDANHDDLHGVFHCGEGLLWSAVFYFCSESLFVDRYRFTYT